MPSRLKSMLSATEREQAILAPYALHSEQTAGRRFPEAVHPYRSPFQRDRDRIIHCAAYRRLSEKMQVFTAEFGSYHRTRMTHTLEVVSVARTIARALDLNEDLVEVVGLLHDIGHPPFGHTGEGVLDDLLKADGGFDHNRQALRIVEKLERRYPDFPGLNLSREVLAAQEFKVEKMLTPLLEVQVVDVADSIAYDTADADDALELGLLTTEQLVRTPLWKRSAERIRKHWTALDDEEFRRAVIHDLIDTQVGDVLEATRRRFVEYNVSSVADALATPFLVAPSRKIAEKKTEMEKFLLENVYRHPKIVSHRNRVRNGLEALFDDYLQRIDTLPSRYAAVTKAEGPRRAVGDFLADHTDRSAQLEHLRLIEKQETAPKRPLDKAFTEK